MSQDGIIYLIGNLGLSDPYRMFCRLVDRLSERAHFYQTNKRILPAAIYRSAAQNGGISLLIIYRLLSGQTIRLQLTFSHQSPEGRFIQADVPDPFYMSGDLRFPTMYDLAGQEALNDAEELLLRFFGLLDTSMYDSELFHAGYIFNQANSYLEESSYIYHQEVGEFGRDFLRIYAFHDQAMIQSKLLWDAIDLARLPPEAYESYRFDPISSWRKEYPLQLREIYRLGSPERFAFYDAITRQRADQMAQLSSQQICDLLYEVLAEHPQRRSFDLGDYGFCVSGPLDAWLSSLYRAMLEKALKR
jgi:hypothetical protein